MADTKRVIAATRRVSLGDFADGWDECYAVVRLASFAEYEDVSKTDFTGMNVADTLKHEIEFVKSHFVSGKILVLDETTSESSLQNMTKDDVDAIPSLPDYLYTVVMGMNLDPKALKREAQDTSAPSTSESITKTS